MAILWSNSRRPASMHASWELYLFIFLREAGCRLDRSRNAPDFVCDHFGLEFCLEAVTVNPSQAGTDPEPPKTPAQVRQYNEHFTPIRFGNALLAKLRKRYWGNSRMLQVNLALAIQDFHQPGSMIWSHSGLPTYLYGYGHEPILQRARRACREADDILLARVGHALATLGIFFPAGDGTYQCGCRSSNSATISKFNRIGKLGRFGDPDIRMIRTGEALDHDPERNERGIKFRHEVGDRYVETWARASLYFIIHTLASRYLLSIFRSCFITTFATGRSLPCITVVSIPCGRLLPLLSQAISRYRWQGRVTLNRQATSRGRYGTGRSRQHNEAVAAVRGIHSNSCSLPRASA